MSDETVTYDELALIGWNVCNLVASMQMAGHNNPVHTLDYRHGPKSPEVQFVEDFARVCNKGGTRASDEYDRMTAFSDAHGIPHLLVQGIGEVLASALDALPTEK